MIATLDTNVLVSAVLFRGTPNRLFTAAVEGQYTLAISARILEEFRGVLMRPKFGLSPALVDVLVRDVESAAVLVSPSIEHQYAIIDCAVQSASDFMVSGDRHLLQRPKLAGIPVVTATRFAELLPR